MDPRLFASRIAPLAGLLLLLATLSGCGPDAPPAPEDTLDALSAFPEGTQNVSMVDLQHLKNEAGISFFGERGIQLTLLDSDVLFDPLSREQRADLNAFIDASGFNPDTDLQSVFIGASPIGDSDALNDPLMILRADFTRDRLASSLNEASDLVTPIDAEHDVPVFAFTRNAADEDTSSNRQMALLDNRRIAVGHASDITALLDRIDTETPGFTPSAEDRELIGHAAAAGSAWSILLTLPDEMDTLSTQVDEQSDAEEWQRRMARVATVTRQLALGLTLTNDDVEARLTLVADDNARDVRRLLSGLAAGAQSHESISADQRAALEDIEINDRGRFVHIDLNTTQRALAEMIINAR